MSKIATLIALVLTVAAAAATTASPALADQVVPTGMAPVVVIRSSSGTVNVERGKFGEVRVTGNDAASATQFQLATDNQGRVALPSGGGLPTRRVLIPGIHAGSMAIRIDNPGGPITVFVPPRVTALFVKADSGDVAMSNTRGPYILVVPAGNVDLDHVFGFGNVRTTQGHVNLNTVGGVLRVETGLGTVSGLAMYTQRADITTQGGAIQWNFSRVGEGPYHFTSVAGDVHVGLDATSAASIDMQSMQGSVLNRFARGAAMVRFRNAHAASLSLGGGGPQITAASQSGRVDIGPRLRPRIR